MSGKSGSVIKQCGNGECEIDINITVTNNFIIKDFKKVVHDYSNGALISIDINNIPDMVKTNKGKEPNHWTYIIYPSGDNGKVVYVFLESKNAQDITIEARYSILGKQGNVAHTRLGEEYTPNDTLMGIPFIEHDKLFAPDSDLLPNSDLNLLFELKIKKKSAKNQSLKYSNNFMGDMYKSLFEDADRFDADFVIECKDGVEVKCHRGILAAAFSYFETMSSAPMIEKESKRVKWMDIDAETCKVALKFIYTGQLESSDISLELYQLAARFFLDELKTRCSSHLMLTLNIDNCINRIVWADRLDDKNLKRKAADFIDKNSEKLEGDVRKALKGNDSLALDLYFRNKK